MLDRHLEEDLHDESPADHGWVHEDCLPDMQNLEDQVKGIIDALYVSGDIRQLEAHLNELCSEIGMNHSVRRPQLGRSGLADKMQWHLGYQRALIDTMNRKI